MEQVGATGESDTTDMSGSKCKNVQKSDVQNS